MLGPLDPYGNLLCPHWWTRDSPPASVIDILVFNRNTKAWVKGGLIKTVGAEVLVWGFDSVFVRAYG